MKADSKMTEQLPFPCTTEDEVHVDTERFNQLTEHLEYMQGQVEDSIEHSLAWLHVYFMLDVERNYRLGQRQSKLVCTPRRERKLFRKLKCWRSVKNRPGFKSVAQKVQTSTSRQDRETLRNILEKKAYQTHVDSKSRKRAVISQTYSKRSSRFWAISRRKQNILERPEKPILEQSSGYLSKGHALRPKLHIIRNIGKGRYLILKTTVPDICVMSNSSQRIVKSRLPPNTLPHLQLSVKNVEKEAGPNDFLVTKKKEFNKWICKVNSETYVRNARSEPHLSLPEIKQHSGHSKFHNFQNRKRVLKSRSQPYFGSSPNSSFSSQVKDNVHHIEGTIEEVDGLVVTGLAMKRNILKSFSQPKICRAGRRSHSSTPRLLFRKTERNEADIQAARNKVMNKNVWNTSSGDNKKHSAFKSFAFRSDMSIGNHEKLTENRNRLVPKFQEINKTKDKGTYKSVWNNGLECYLKDFKRRSAQIRSDKKILNIEVNTENIDRLVPKFQEISKTTDKQRYKYVRNNNYGSEGYLKDFKRRSSQIRSDKKILSVEMNAENLDRLVPKFQEISNTKDKGRYTSVSNSCSEGYLKDFKRRSSQIRTDKKIQNVEVNAENIDHLVTKSKEIHKTKGRYKSVWSNCPESYLKDFTRGSLKSLSNMSIQNTEDNSENSDNLVSNVLEINKTSQTRLVDIEMNRDTTNNSDSKNPEINKYNLQNNSETCVEAAHSHMSEKNPDSELKEMKYLVLKREEEFRSPFIWHMGQKNPQTELKQKEMKCLLLKHEKASDAPSITKVGISDFENNEGKSEKVDSAFKENTNFISITSCHKLSERRKSKQKPVVRNIEINKRKPKSMVSKCKSLDNTLSSVGLNSPNKDRRGRKKEYSVSKNKDKRRNKLRSSLSDVRYVTPKSLFPNPTTQKRREKSGGSVSKTKTMRKHPTRPKSTTANIKRNEELMVLIRIALSKKSKSKTTIARQRNKETAVFKSNDIGKASSKAITCKRNEETPVLKSSSYKIRNKSSKSEVTMGNKRHAESPVLKSKSNENGKVPLRYKIITANKRKEETPVFRSKRSENGKASPIRSKINENGKVSPKSKTTSLFRSKSNENGKASPKSKTTSLFRSKSNENGKASPKYQTTSVFRSKSNENGKASPKSKTNPVFRSKSNENSKASLKSKTTPVFRSKGNENSKASPKSKTSIAIKSSEDTPVLKSKCNENGKALFKSKIPVAIKSSEHTPVFRSRSNENGNASFKSKIPIAIKRSKESPVFRSKSNENGKVLFKSKIPIAIKSSEHTPVFRSKSNENGNASSKSKILIADKRKEDTLVLKSNKMGMTSSKSEITIGNSRIEDTPVFKSKSYENSMASSQSKIPIANKRNKETNEMGITSSKSEIIIGNRRNEETQLLKNISNKMENSSTKTKRTTAINVVKKSNEVTDTISEPKSTDSNITSKVGSSVTKRHECSNTSSPRTSAIANIKRNRENPVMKSCDVRIIISQPKTTITNIKNLRGNSIRKRYEVSNTFKRPKSTIANIQRSSENTAAKRHEISNTGSQPMTTITNIQLITRKPAFKSYDVRNFTSQFKTVLPHIMEMGVK